MKLFYKLLLQITRVIQLALLNERNTNAATRTEFMKRKIRNISGEKCFIIYEETSEESQKKEFWCLICVISLGEMDKHLENWQNIS